MGGCQGNSQGLSYVLEIIRTELIGRHHDEGTPASRKLENSSPKNAMKTCNRYQYLSTSHDSGGIAYVHRLEGHKSRLGQDCLFLPIGRKRVTTWARLPMSTHWKDTSYDLILVIVGLQDETVQISQYTRAAGDNFRHYNSMPQSPRVSN